MKKYIVNIINRLQEVTSSVYIKKIKKILLSYANGDDTYDQLKNKLINLAMKKKVYEEQYRTLVLFTRICYFTVASNADLDKDDDLTKRIFDICDKNKLYSQQNLGFIHFRCSKKRYKIFTPFFQWIGFSRMCPIYNIPGCHAADNTNPRKMYQKWCKAFDGQFTPKELEYIEKVAIKEGDDRRYFADIAWENLKDQKQWTFSRELLNLFLTWKERLHYS